MYRIKNKIFLELSKTQKSAICNFLRALVKKSPNLDVDKILEKFLEDERYYLELDTSRFEFLNNFIDDRTFIYETKLYIKGCKKYYEYKKKQEPLIKAQKEYDKKKRKFLQEVKMSKEFPSKKQVSYYKSLCKRYNIEIKSKNENGEYLSKLDFKKMIEEIINEHKTN